MSVGDAVPGMTLPAGRLPVLQGQHIRETPGKTAGGGWVRTMRLILLAQAQVHPASHGDEELCSSRGWKVFTKLQWLSWLLLCQLDPN